MRIFRDNNDHNDEDPDEGRNESHEPIDPKAIGDILADEFADYLADVTAAADNPPPQHRQPTDDTEPPARPTLRLVKNDDTDTDTDEGDKPLDPRAAAAAGRAARRRLVRGAAGGSAVVVTATALATWGQPWMVAGPLAAYSTGWLAYLWWNAALRPSIPDVLTTLTSAVSTAFAVVITTLAAIVRGLVDRIDTARTRHETSRTTPVSQSL
ncbi:hypothetical protein OH799_32920 [Nocardia sp. NBC_00881]|uniref:hypothetical protein n=1 Tax=Nocardia sp. NBC_00881 TaxID=2975995 RepID=UPI0038636DC3|nr:hypothetical protein OH799_32920 [Nocardia sp. NBC_00881]